MKNRYHIQSVSVTLDAKTRQTLQEKVSDPKKRRIVVDRQRHSYYAAACDDITAAHAAVQGFYCAIKTRCFAP